MLITTDKKLSDNQVQRIEHLEKEWFEELEKLSPLNSGPCQLSHAANKPGIDLNNKYITLIRKVLEE